MSQFAEVLRDKHSWLLSTFYFQTFGGFVALSLYMPMLLKEVFGLAPADAGFRTAAYGTPRDGNRSNASDIIRETGGSKTALYVIATHSMGNLSPWKIPTKQNHKLTSQVLIQNQIA